MEIVEKLKHIDRNPLRKSEKINKKNASVENSITKKMNTGRSFYYEGFVSYDFPKIQFALQGQYWPWRYLKISDKIMLDAWNILTLLQVGKICLSRISTKSSRHILNSTFQTFAITLVNDGSFVNEEQHFMSREAADLRSRQGLKVLFEACQVASLAREVTWRTDIQRLISVHLP